MKLSADSLWSARVTTRAVRMQLPRLTKVVVIVVLFSAALTPILRADDFCGRLPFGPHNPYEMSYGMLWNYIQEFENPRAPENLQHNLRGYEISIGVGFNEQGLATGCGGVIVRKPYEKAIKISHHLEKSVTAALCPSIMTWKFRPLIYCSKPVPVEGVVVFRDEEQKFVLIEVMDPRFRKGPAPVERKAD